MSKHCTYGAAAGEQRVKVRQLREICPIKGGWAMKKPSHGRPVYRYTSELHDSLCLHNLTIGSQLSRYAPSLSLYFRSVLSSCSYPLNMVPFAFPLPFVWYSCSAVEAQCHKQQSCGFESLQGHLIFSDLPNTSSSTVSLRYSASNRNEYQMQKNNVSGSKVRLMSRKADNLTARGEPSV
jgi:hypothetical protein